MAREILPWCADSERREARYAACHQAFGCNAAVAAAIDAFLDQQKTFIDVALRDTDASDFARWNDRFTAATVR